MKIKKLDISPPQPTGDSKVDLKALHEYLSYQTEQINYILTLIEKELNNGN